MTIACACEDCGSTRNPLHFDRATMSALCVVCIPAPLQHFRQRRTEQRADEIAECERLLATAQRRLDASRLRVRGPVLVGVAS